MLSFSCILTASKNPDSAIADSAFVLLQVVKNSFTMTEFADPKLVDLIASREGSVFVSIEFFPPKTAEGVNSLYKVLEKLKIYKPLFADVTWGAGGSTSDLTLELCKGIKERGVVSNMHLTCTNMEAILIDNALAGCKSAGIANILALRGDPPAGESVWHASDKTLTCALDLVQYIRKDYSKQDLCLTVAGYPEGHPTSMSVVNEGISALSESELTRYSIDVNEKGEEVVLCCRDADFEREMKYLKSKIDAGADCIITQMIFDPHCYRTFVDACRAIGITVPIIPGIMCISAYAGFKRMTKFCKSRVPDSMLKALEEANKAVDETAESVAEAANRVKELGVDLVEKLCRQFIELGAPGLHFYTLNSSIATTAVCDRLKQDQVI